MKASLSSKGRRGAGRPTMRDVALEAKVSLKTVSRVVNGESSVAPVTTKQVQKAISRLGYLRNEHARALRQQRVLQMLGLVTEDVSNPFYSAIARGVEEEVRDRALLVVAGSSDEDPARERALLEMLCEQRVAGLLVVPTRGDHGFLAPEIGHGTAVVFVDRPPANLAADTVLLDNFGGAKSGVEHLLSYGHRRVGFVGDLPDIYTTAERLRGYEIALASAGLDAGHALVRLGCHDSSSAAAAVQELLELSDPPTALFACNNRITFGALQCFGATSRPVALVGFDDFELAPLLSPPVTVVSYDQAEVGRRAARLVCDRIDGMNGPPRKSVIPTTVVARGSGEVKARQVAAPSRRPARTRG